MASFLGGLRMFAGCGETTFPLECTGGSLYLPTVQIRSHSRVRLALSVLCGMFFATSPVSAASAPSLPVVIEDAPGRLVIELTVPRYVAADGADGQRVLAEGFPNLALTGAPDLPSYTFRVATGPRMPRVVIEPIEWVEVPLPRGLAGVPRWVTNRTFEPHKDPALFAAARTLTPGINELERVRGLELRSITVPLGTWIEGSGSARMLARFRVRVEFPEPAASAAPGVRPWLAREGVLNPRGGAHLTAHPRPAVLRRSAAASNTLSEEFLRIRIGNREVDDLSTDGIHALTFATARGVAGSRLDGIPVERLRLFTGPKDTLTVRLNAPPSGPVLREIPIEVRDANNNGIFDAGDTILFYGHGTSIWVPLPGAPGPIRWVFKNDPWSFDNHYFLDWSPGPQGLRFDTAAFTAPAATVTRAPQYLRAERDLNTGSCDPAGLFDTETGYAWYWFGRFVCRNESGPLILPGNQLSRSSTSTLAGRSGDSTYVGMFNQLAATNFHEFRVWSSGDTLPFVMVGAAGSWYLKTSGYGTNDALGFDSVVWLGGSPRFEGYSVRYQRSLAWTGQNRAVFPAAVGQRVGYQISNPSAALRVLRVESGAGARWMELQPSGGSVLFADSVGPADDVVYYMYGGGAIPVASPAVALEAVFSQGGPVVQNLVTGDGLDPEYLILAPQALLPEAVQLAEYRADAGRIMPLATAVVRAEDVYREWSGGRMSPVALRDFLRWSLNNWGPGGGMGNLKYVVLFGDGHYDYRNIRNGVTINPLPNHIPPFNWQDLGSNPMSTDDFFGVVDSGQIWHNGSVALAVGRIPVQTREQARDYLEKVRVYEHPASSGEWRSRVLMTADDATQRRAEGGVDPITRHTQQAERVGTTILEHDSGRRMESVYLFDYPHNAAFLKPEATQALINQLNRGTLLFNFFGHGAYNQLADEVFLKTNDGLARVRNGHRNFCMTIFSCTVGRFDKLNDEGMTEQFVRQREHGAIVGIAGTRETFPDPNESLAVTFAAQAFAASLDSVPVALGQHLRLSKNLTPNNDVMALSNNKKYALLGDPAITLRRPGIGLQLESIPDTLRALDCGTITGRVNSGSGRGHVNIRIVSGDVPKSYTYRVRPLNRDTMATTTVQKRGQILFERTVPYEDSVFSMDYFLPKQVPFGDTAAKIQAFAWDAEFARESAVLVEGLPIDGTASETCMDDDKRGPRITIAGCNVRESGAIDFPDRVSISLPYCVQVTVSDTGSGVLGGEGPDQGTTIEVIGSVAPFQPEPILDELYAKTFQTTFSPQEIAPGSHVLRISSRDGFGNLSQRQVTLDVSEGDRFRFVRAFNVPNPMRDAGTTFHFMTTLPADEGFDLTEPNVDRVRFHLRIFNQRGHMVQEFRNAISGETRWDGRDAWGQRLANGVYFYEVTAIWSETDGAPDGGRRVSRKNTLVISR